MNRQNSMQSQHSVSNKHICLTRMHSISVSEVISNADTKISKKLTRNEFLTLAAICCGHLCLGTLYALLAPFFPTAAEEKGISPTQYGFIFGIFEFGQFVFAPVAGIMIPIFSTKYSITGGLCTSACSTMLFAGLMWSPSGQTFFWIAFMLRLVTAAGNVMYFTAAFTLIVTDFPHRISTLFSMIEMCVGLGMIIGPSVGGILYEYGGFACPFFAIGVITLLASLFASFSMPRPKPVTKNVTKVNLISLVTKLGVFMNLLITFTCFLNVGFNDATLEHHLTEFTSLSPTSIGGMFVVSGLIYALTTQLWGIVIQRFKHAILFVAIGFIFTGAAFVLCGPAFPLPIKPSLTLVIIGQAMYGIGIGPQLVGAFTGSLEEAFKSGFPDDVTTSASVSSVYQAACALGAAVGPVVGGILMDNWGYSKACSLVVIVQLSMIGILILFTLWRMGSAKKSTANGA